MTTVRNSPYFRHRRGYIIISCVGVLLAMKQVREFLLTHEKPQDFVQCQWCVVSKLTSWYVVYRCFFGLFFAVTMTYSILSDERNTKWLIYFTNWSFLLCTIQANMAAVLVIREVLRKKCPVPGSGMPASYQVYWLFHTISIVFTLSLTAFYWTFLYKSGVTRIDWVNLQVHGVNAALLIIDLFLVKHPFRIQHIYVSFLCSLLFPIFTLFYHLSGGTNRDGDPYVYTVMDWRDYRQGLKGSFLGQSTILIMHVVTWILYLVKIKILSCFQRSALDITKYTQATAI